MAGNTSTPPDARGRFLVVGAGSSGLAAVKSLIEAGITVDCLEREDDVGGNWYYGRPHSSVYASTHTISSKRLTEYVDFPMPKEYPQYPHHRQVWEYLRSYARHFGLYERIEFGRGVERLERAGGGWQVRLDGGETRHYRGVVIANGHNWDPRFPSFPGKFDGLSLHSSQYKTPEVFAGKRVLVVGAGNSGCDIAVDAAQHADRALISMRRGYHYLPKFWRGLPIDALNETLLRWRVPLAVRRGLASFVARLAFGRAGRNGLPRPDHRLFETHPIINQQLYYYIAHGRIAPRPDVAEFCGNKVRFADGASETVDVVVYATGFNITFPFIDRELLNWRDGRPRLFLNVFHPVYDDLFVIGLIQPDSGQFGLVDYQSRLMAKFIAACDAGRPEAAAFRRLKREPPDLSAGIRYVDSPRHLLEVEHFSYRKRLQQLLRQL